MAKETVAVMYRHLTHGQLTALLLVQVMAARATRGERFATQFMALAAQRQWGAMAAMASLLSNPDSSPSRSDFRYAVPRDGLLLSLKICCALLVLIVIAAGSLWLSEGGGLQPVQPIPKPPNALPAATDQTSAATDLTSLPGLFRAANRPAEAEPVRRRAQASGKKSFKPDHPGAATGLDNLAELLRALAALPESERRTRLEALSDVDRELLQELGKSGAERDAFPELVPPKP
jgi:hypothetical protein